MATELILWYDPEIRKDGVKIMAGSCRLLFLVFSLVFLSNCGGDDQPLAEEIRNSPAGVWEVRYNDAVGQAYLDVLELRADGTYSSHMQGLTPSDRGTYQVNDGTIAFNSTQDAILSQSFPYLVEDGVLKLYLNTTDGAANTPFVEWQPSTILRKLATVDVSNRKVPTGLSHALAAMSRDAVNWREDALPTVVRISSLPNGEFQTEVNLYSPSAVEILRAMITPFDVRVSTGNGQRAPKIPLPVEFIELPEILENTGFTGNLDRANLQVYGDYGAVWSVRMNNRQGAYVSATTGEVIEEDVTGYIEGYEADWNYAGELWRQVLDSMRSESDPKWPDCDYDLENVECELAGCFWNEDYKTNPTLNEGYCRSYP